MWCELAGGLDLVLFLKAIIHRYATLNFAHGMCFWNGQSHACATKCEKCEKEGKAYALHWKGLKMWVRFRTTQNAKIRSILKTTTHFFCFARCCYSLSYSSFSTQTSWCCGCIYALSSPLFLHQAPSSFFLAPITTFAILTSWQWDR